MAGARKFPSGKALAIAGFVVVAGYLILLPAEKLPISSANGAYESPCCGLVRLRDGTMQFGQQTVDYSVERDKAGAYVMPRHYVGVVGGSRFEVEHRPNPLKIRMDREKEPTSLELMTHEAAYTLHRQR